MSSRSLLRGAVAAALATSALALSAVPAHADVVADDPSFTPVSADLIGVGSDTIQTALHYLAEGATVDGSAVPGYNADHASARIASFAALGGGQITLPSGAINRPNGSGAGKALLYGAGNNTDIDFARSSSAISTTEASNNLYAFPFALDTLQMVTSGNVASHAPAALTGAQIVSIYKGEVTDWADLGGTTGTIKPYIPQSGSGTRSFFLAQLKALNGNVDVTLGANVAEAQEHDPTLIKDDADAVAPFSAGRARLAGSVLRLESGDNAAGGWSAKRALYNVVRGTDLGNADIQAAFGPDGFVCSTAARPLIEAAGFGQLATAAHGGVCGEQTQSASSNFTLNEQVVTATDVVLTSTKAGKADLVATVTGSSAPAGTVTFTEGATTLASDVLLVSGQATAAGVALPAGEHTVTATFTPDEGSQFEASTGEVTGFVKSGASLAETFPATVAKGKKAAGKITVTLTGLAGVATGTVTLKDGSKTLATKALTNGTAAFKVTLKKGKHALKAIYSGSDHAVAASKKFTVTQK